MLVLDPGFDSLTGHHFVHNAAVRAYCKGRGIPCAIYGPAGFAKIVASVDGIALFRSRLYRPQRTALEVLAASAEDNLSFHDDLARMGPIDGRSLLLMHTVNHLQLTGLVAWLDAQPQPRPDVRLILRFQPDFLVGAGGVRLVEHLYAHALRALAKKSPKVRMHCDTAAGEDYYSALAGVRVAKLPAAVDFSALDPSPAPVPVDRGASRFLFIGEARREKGFHLLPDAIRLAQQQRPALEFIIHVTRANPEIIAQLRSLPRVEVTEGRVLNNAGYFAKLREADAVLLAYEPRNYRLRSTYVLVEALGAGRPVVVTGKGSSMLAELRGLQPLPGVIVEDFSAAALARALLAFDARRPELNAAAAQAAPIVREKHNLVRYFAMLFEGAPHHG